MQLANLPQTIYAIKQREFAQVCTAIGHYNQECSVYTAECTPLYARTRDGLCKPNNTRFAFTNSLRKLEDYSYKRVYCDHELIRPEEVHPPTLACDAYETKYPRRSTSPEVGRAVKRFPTKCRSIAYFYMTDNAVKGKTDSHDDPSHIRGKAHRQCADHVSDIFCYPGDSAGRRASVYAIKRPWE